jgi:hypothetical protein
MTRLRIEQTRIAADRFRADVELHTDEGRRRDVSGEFPFTMTDADHADLRWYLEDYLRSPFEPEQKMAGRIEARMQEIGEELFNALFTSQDGQFLLGQHPGEPRPGTSRNRFRYSGRHNRSVGVAPRTERRVAAGGRRARVRPVAHLCQTNRPAGPPR